MSSRSKLLVHLARTQKENQENVNPRDAGNQPIYSTLTSVPLGKFSIIIIININ